MVTRRTALKAGAGALAGGAVLSGSDVGPLELDAIDPTGEADALVWAAAGLAGIAFVGYEVGVLMSDDPPDGLGPDTLKTQILQSAKKRKSVNSSTIVDNQNLLKYIPETAYSEGKLGALDAIKSGATKAEATSAGKQAANEHFAILETNLLKSWNESVNEVMSFVSSVESHSEVSTGFIQPAGTSGVSWNSLSWEKIPFSYTLRDGSSFTINKIRANLSDVSGPDGTQNSLTPTWHPGDTSTPRWFDSGDLALGLDQSENKDVGSVDFTYLDQKDWNDLWSQMQTTFDDILNNISLWVDNVYDQVQTGEISPTEYLSGTDLANTIAAESENAQAIGDLIAMNVPGDYQNEVTVQLLDDDATMKGYISTTDTTNVNSISPGTTIDPDATDEEGNPLYETWYLTFRPGTYIEQWDAYDSSYGIQGGEIRFTSNPKTINGITLGDDYEYVIETSHGESASVPASGFTEETIDSTTYWTADLSDQLSQLITDINRVRRVYTGDNPDTYQTRKIKQSFKVTEIEGETSSLTIQQNREPQTDDNYITEEEWTEIKKQQEDLIDRYEEAASGGGASPVDGLPDLGIIPNYVPANKYIEYGLVGIVALFGFNVATN